MRPQALGWMVVALLAVTAAGCSGDRGGAALGDGAGSAPTGEALYASKCASCHGSDLRGTAQGPSQLSVVYEPNHHADASYRVAITEGVRAHHWDFGDMPAIGGLDADEVTAVIGYIRWRQQAEGFEPYPPR